ncbi:GNAT family N-acetyltransferase [Pseudomonas baetica]|uniref:GNAT family N-acetyltransferase n=1 Tax=Pseudomonas baetica TaxID=674054 RepID=UPI0024060E49|nr:GNAT family N-acetyltransferase [Pseudomonas baetica]MDF9779284.1 GNAT superfamily N-acetyltransferase [Pseudomonas baetica]
MEIMHFTDGINPRVLEESLRLAISEAPAMVGQHIDSDSPLLALAEAEVGILLGGSLRMVGAGARQEFKGVMCDLRVGVIAAIDDEAEVPRLAGFIQYKPRLLTEGVATIGYAAVVEEHRGKGVFKQMLDVLKSRYPVIGLDCPLELVPFYEKLGFHADNIQHAHVGMSNGPLSGINWMQDQEYLENQKPYQLAKAAIRDKLGKRTDEAYAKRDADTRKRVEEIKVMLAARGVDSADRTQQSA